MLFQSKIYDEKIETSNETNISTRNVVNESKIVNIIKKEPKESQESKLIEELLTQNYELKSLILKVIYFLLTQLIVKNVTFIKLLYSNGPSIKILQQI